MTKSPAHIPAPIANWFADKNWQIRDYQKSMVEAYAAKQDTLLIAPTGGGKTLAGFLPSLVDLLDKPENAEPKLHTLYISPLRALTNDIERNLNDPISEAELPITVSVRTGDTNSYQRTKQRETPPDMLLTTPESLMLLLSYPDAAKYFAHLKCVIIDELHSFATNKRGDFTALALARLKTLAPDHIRFGLSATIADPQSSAQWLGPTNSPAGVIEVRGDVTPKLSIMDTQTRLPLGGHNARYAAKDIYTEIKSAQSVIVFVNTRAQAEMMFQQLWQVNTDALPIAIYHGSLSREQRQKTETLVASGIVRAVVSTSALEMGIDWGDVDKIIQVGAPKGVSRLLQRIGRSNHRLDEPSEALLVPTNPLEAIECKAAIDAIAKGQRDGEDYQAGAKDVVVQYLVNRACSDPMDASETYTEIKSAWPYRDLDEDTYIRLLSVAEDGGYALKAYDRFNRLTHTNDGYRITNQQQARRHRMNIGTIVEYAKLKVHRFPNAKSKRYRKIGQIEERFVVHLTPGDSFIFGGEILQYHGIKDMAVKASPMPKRTAPKVPSYAGGVMPLSTYLAEGVRDVLSSSQNWTGVSDFVRSWLELQREFSVLPNETGLLVEGFYEKRDQLQTLVAHTFEGRKVNQTLGLLITRRMETLGLKPVSFSITDYALTLTALEEADTVAPLFTPDILEHEFEDWVMNSPMVRRSFRKVATIAGLVEQRMPGEKRTMKSLTFSTDLIFDVLMKYEPDHVLLQVSREDAERSLLDISRVRTWLEAIQGDITYHKLPQASPLAIPSMMQLGKEKVIGAAQSADLIAADLQARGEDMLNTVRDYVDQRAH